MDLRLITAPVSEPVSLTDVQAHVRAPVDGADAAVIEAYLQAAREIVEAHTGRVLMPQTWQIVLPEFPADNGPIMLPKPPLVSVTSVAITNADGEAETISGALYQVATPSGAHAQVFSLPHEIQDHGIGPQQAPPRPPVAPAHG